jgi:hypothetical protein
VFFEARLSNPALMLHLRSLSCSGMAKVFPETAVEQHTISDRQQITILLQPNMVMECGSSVTTVLVQTFQEQFNICTFLPRMAAYTVNLTLHRWPRTEWDRVIVLIFERQLNIMRVVVNALPLVLPVLVGVGKSGVVLREISQSLQNCSRRQLTRMMRIV